MTYQVLYGEDLTINDLEEIMELDCRNYEDKYHGELKQLKKRFKRNKDSFVCIKDDTKIIGYINFFPTTDTLWNDIIEKNDTIRDDDIEPEEIADYQKNNNKLYIISIVIDKSVRDKSNTAVKELTLSFIKYLNQLNSKYKITEIAACTVSDDGIKFLRRLFFREKRTLKDGKNKIFVCNNSYLEHLLNNKIYYKTYTDDIYLLLPYTDNIHKNNLINNFLNSEDTHPKDDEIITHLFDNLKISLDYECKNTVVSELNRRYLGTYNFLHTLDNYDDKEEGPFITGNEKVYISILAHQKSNMYIIMLFIPNCRFSTSQIFDQANYGHLMISKTTNNKDNMLSDHFVKLDEMLLQNYGIVPCGSGKYFTCMTNLPDTNTNSQEFHNILAGESYNSFKQDFFISCPKLSEATQNNLSIYDYYDVYMSEKVIAFILNKDNKDIKTRIELSSTYIFIIELITFQNIALNIINNRVSKALSDYSGNVSYIYIYKLYESYAKTIDFWQNDNFKYLGTQREADNIRKAFGNDEYRQRYNEQQEFLEHLVDLKMAQYERRTGTILNIAAIFLALMQVQGYIVNILKNIMGNTNLSKDIANTTFDFSLIGFIIIWFLTLIIKKLLNKNRIKKLYIYKTNSSKQK